MRTAYLHSAGVDLSKLLEGKPKYWREKVAISDMGVSKLLGVPGFFPNVNAYASQSSE